MNRKIILGLVVCALILVVGLALQAAPDSLAAPAAPAADYRIAWWTVDSGGGRSQGGTYALNGTAGQADAGVSSGGTYRLTGGYWSSVPTYRAFIPLLSK